MVDSNREFRTDMAQFADSTRRRVVTEVLALIAVSIALFSDFSYAEAIPVSIRLAIVAAFSLYIAFGLLGYSNAKSVVEKLSVRLQDEHIEFLGVKGSHVYNYSGLSIAKVRRRAGSVVGIKLSIENDGSLWLTGYEDMDVLFARLSNRLRNI